ncbi:MAG: LacI family DNA-binding transcriptional regulator [Paracoccaceae bacterium]|nr:LacI family DNA-binding transcriptional regulator [Paracoccaceae bacterium]
MPQRTKHNEINVKVTMKDVALAAGVSQSTVSFVLNGQEDMRIGADTKERVLKAAETLGYRYRPAGRPSAWARHKVIGIMIDEIATSPFGAISIEGVQERAWSAGVMTEIVMTGGDRSYEQEMLQKWARDGVEGVIYASILTREVEPPIALRKHRAVLLNCHDKASQFAAVVPAERRGGYAAAAALIAEGYQRIAFITGETWMEASEQRREGYMKAMADHGLMVDPALVRPGNFLPSGGRAATIDLLDLSERPEAIFCANDLMAVGCYEAIKERGLRVGADIAVVGYDDQEIAQHLAPALSTVLLPHREMGIWCVRQLLKKSEIKPHVERLTCPFVPRVSHHR